MQMQSSRETDHADDDEKQQIKFHWPKRKFS